MPLIGKIQIYVGVAFLLFCVIKYVTSRPKPKKKGVLLIRNVCVIDGNGNVQEGQNVLVKDGKFAEISPKPIRTRNVQMMDGTGKFLMPGLIDSHVHIQGLNSQNDAESDLFLEDTVPSIFKDKLSKFPQEETAWTTPYQVKKLN